MKTFDPIKLSEETEKQMTDGDKRKYNTFRVENFYGQLATARGVGCNIRCGFCWINPSRDKPNEYGEFYSPQEVYDKLVEVSSNRHGRSIMTEGVRISGCEPTLGKEHLLSFIELCKKGNDFRWFLLETNGILLGNDENYVKALGEFDDYVHIRLSFKAGTPSAFEKKTGARAEFFSLPFRALKYLIKHKMNYRLAAMSKDPALMPIEERRGFLEQLCNYGVGNLRLLEEEKADPFGVTKRRLVESEIITRPEEINQEEYEPLLLSFRRAVEGKQDISIEELRAIIKEIEFKIRESGCVTCNRESLWHGHDVEDDLDAKLK
jgi:uncharacterized Fe-S cluster-containing radical SAM superfamily protein